MELKVIDENTARNILTQIKSAGGDCAAAFNLSVVNKVKVPSTDDILSFISEEELNDPKDNNFIEIKGIGFAKVTPLHIIGIASKNPIDSIHEVFPDFFNNNSQETVCDTVLGEYMATDTLNGYGWCNGHQINISPLALVDNSYIISIEGMASFSDIVKCAKGEYKSYMYTPMTCPKCVINAINDLVVKNIHRFPKISNKYFILEADVVKHECCINGIAYRITDKLFLSLDEKYVKDPESIMELYGYGTSNQSVFDILVVSYVDEIIGRGCIMDNNTGKINVYEKINIDLRSGVLNSIILVSQDGNAYARAAVSRTEDIDTVLDILKYEYSQRYRRCVKF